MNKTILMILATLKTRRVQNRPSQRGLHSDPATILKILTLTVVAVLSSSGRSYCQEINFTKPVKLGVNVNSQYEESNPLLSEDGKTLYFVRTGDPNNSGGEEGGQDVWFSSLINGQWTPASNDLKMINNGDNNAVVGTADAGNKLFLINTYSAHPRRDHGVAYSTKTEGDWIAPRELDLIFKMKSDFYGFYMTPDEDILLISMKGESSVGEEDLYVSFKKDSVWTKPIHMGDIINSEGFEISPFLSADKKTLYFSSNGFGGLGSADVFRARRLDDSWTRWSKPENLGAPVNSSAFDAYFSVYEDKAFFSSNREGDHADIYAMGIEAPVEEEPAPVAMETSEEEPAPEATTETQEESTNKEKEEVKEKVEEQTFTVYFPFDDAELSEEAKGKLINSLDALQKAESITIKGYTDSQGPEEYNIALSGKRAEAVADFLQTKGLDSGKIETSGEGEKDPVASNEILEQRKQNRRVTVEIR